MAVALWGTAAVAKCATQTYTVSGHVSGSHGTVPPNTRVEVQWRDNVSRAPHRVPADVPADGAYEISIPFYPYSGSRLFGNRCEASLKQVQVSLTAQGVLVAREEVALHGKTAVVDFSLKP